MIIVASSALKGIREGALRECCTGPSETGDILTEVEAIRDTHVYAQTMAGVGKMEMKVGSRGSFHRAFYTKEEK